LIEKKETKFDDVKAELLKSINDKPISPADARLFLDDIKKAAKVDRKIGAAPLPKLDSGIDGVKGKKTPVKTPAPVKVKQDKPGEE
jgi:hypothetical protein